MNLSSDFVVHFLTFLKTVPWYDCASKRTSFWEIITIRFGLAQQEKIGQETSAKQLHYLLT